MRIIRKLLLLARGACIETSHSPLHRGQPRCSSQEEHVLKLMQRGELGTKLCCSSQEEHVLKPRKPGFLRLMPRCSSQEEHVLKQQEGRPDGGDRGCSSQEEHVLKLNLATLILHRLQLLLARGACIETITQHDPSAASRVAPRKRSMY